ncbi:Sister chromatid cohesion protein 2 [Exophiala xenobiotica]|nr:Sister chromatid cohesion protein 2 [Exophiala xenobiotica]
MAMNDTIEVSVPRRSQYGRNSRQFTVDEAIQYTPMTTSILPAHESEIAFLYHNYDVSKMQGSRILPKERLHTEVISIRLEQKNAWLSY